MLWSYRWEDKKCEAVIEIAEKKKKMFANLTSQLFHNIP